MLLKIFFLLDANSTERKYLKIWYYGEKSSNSLKTLEKKPGR